MIVNIAASHIVHQASIHKTAGWLKINKDSFNCYRLVEKVGAKHELLQWYIYRLLLFQLKVTSTNFSDY